MQVKHESKGPFGIQNYPKMSNFNLSARAASQSLSVPSADAVSSARGAQRRTSSVAPSLPRQFHLKFALNIQERSKNRPLLSYIHSIYTLFIYSYLCLSSLLKGLTNRLTDILSQCLEVNLSSSQRWPRTEALPSSSPEPFAISFRRRGSPRSSCTGPS